MTPNSGHNDFGIDVPFRTGPTHFCGFVCGGTNNTEEDSEGRKFLKQAHLQEQLATTKTNILDIIAHLQLSFD
jgi:hypothetical protein